MAHSKKNVRPYEGEQLELLGIAENLGNSLFTNSGAEISLPQPPVPPTEQGSGGIELVNNELNYVRGDRKEGHCIYAISIRSRRYFRYDAWIGHRKIYSLHIPGGSVDASLAQSRALSVVEALRLGRHRDEVAAMIRGWARPRYRVGDGKR